MSQGRLTANRLSQLSGEGSCRRDAGPYYPSTGTAIATTEWMNEILYRNPEFDPMRLADDDQLTARLQFKRTGEAMADGRPPLSPSTLRAELQQVRLRENLSKPRDLRHVPDDLQHFEITSVASDNSIPDHWRRP